MLSCRSSRRATFKSAQNTVSEGAMSWMIIRRLRITIISILGTSQPGLLTIHLHIYNIGSLATLPNSALQHSRIPITTFYTQPFAAHLFDTTPTPVLLYNLASIAGTLSPLFTWLQPILTPYLRQLLSHNYRLGRIVGNEHGCSIPRPV